MTYKPDQTDTIEHIALGNPFNESLLLDEKEWSKFQEIMDSDDEPTEKLRQLFQY